ncbi:ligand-binding sensor domain-containing protein [Pedobacter heparinus]|uniref:ATP-binding region ATPase domain protein n=2 Tax=Pedobacter heparinus TaxID=984 RepID=C6XUI0_PEDHD|nr:sensor histidine kinase [Pedobacter heparinus]ACU03830.1 ATP-binding region ATPase domain protein [Pedobacter heparinus DSM 2366]
MLFLLASGLQAFSQRYNFEHYNIEDGLVQSQVTAITQDKQRRLWIATLGGLSCFNGNQFINFGKTDGLNSNFILSLAVNDQNSLFIGSGRGLSAYNGFSFYHYKETNNWTDMLVAGTGNMVYGLSDRHLFKTNRSATERVNISRDTAEMVTTLTTDQGGKIWAAVYTHGIYSLEGNKWQAKITGAAVKNLVVTGLLIDKFVKDKIWLLTTTGIFLSEHGKLLSRYAGKIKKATAILQDEKGNIWLGTNKGAWYISTDHEIYFNAKNGFTDNVVKQIFRDAENNIWFGTDGSGIYRFNSNGYVTFDESQGLQNNIVMSIVNGPKPDEIWLGTYDGLFSQQNNQIRRISIPSDNEDTKRINVLLKDSKNDIWVGTVGGGLWLYHKNRFKRIDHESRGIACNAIMEDRDHNIWLSTNTGCFMVDNLSKKISRISPRFGSSLLEIGKDSIITGTQNGAYLVNHKKEIKRLKFRLIEGSSILAMLKNGPDVFFGTADNGLIIWDTVTGKVKQLSTKNGLFSDHIYSLLLDKRGTIWIGTGRGINRLNSKDHSLIKGNDGNALLVECNQNAILEKDDKIWIGTTKGAIVHYNKISPSVAGTPYVFINSAGVLSQNKKGDQNNLQITYKERELNQEITLPYDHNHLNINFTGIYLTNPKALMYTYRLIGLDTTYSKPAANSSINYTALPPGKYTFQVKALTVSGIESGNTAAIQFQITPPYYQTAIFKIFILLVILLLIILSVYVIINLNERQRRLRLKIKLEEQFKIRKQTAEDFHDDLGNKLTRISVLSEVLTSMTDQDDTEKRAIIQKIKTNVNELYTGTKDILWSLNPKHDTLCELLTHIREFGQEMFNGTPILFEEETSLNDTDSRLSLEMSRNILMIFKEAIHNALKHSKADHVKFTAKMAHDVLDIRLDDNGTGFDVASAGNGHGINNMNVRAARINGILNIISNTKGTTIALSVKFKTSKNAESGRSKSSYHRR